MKSNRWIAWVLFCALACSMLPFPSALGAAAPSFRLLLSDDNADLELMLKAYAARQNLDLSITYEGVGSITDILRGDDCPYDAVWLSNSIWLAMLPSGSQKVTDAKATCINPVIFGVTQEKAQALGLTGEVWMRDIVRAMQSGALRFVLPSVTQTNSGASAYLGVVSTLSGNPVVLTEAHLQNTALQTELLSLFSGVQRSSGSDAYALQLVEDGQFDCVVSTEHSLLALNRRLTGLGKPPMQLLYPVDGVSLADAPLAYLDQGDPGKKQTFLALQAYVLGTEGQRELWQLGRRAGFGGLVDPAYASLFPSAWGVKTDSYISAVNYPARDVMRGALAMYQTAFRKPSVTVLCLDFSGSMTGTGHKQLIEAMTYLLTPESASVDNLQFTAGDKVTILPFTSAVSGSFSGHGGQSLELLKKVQRLSPGGGTNVYNALSESLRLLDTVDAETHIASIVLMTDGQSEDEFARFQKEYQDSGSSIPVYSILFGNADSSQLEDIAALTQGAVFDGRGDLQKAFRIVRGYN